MGLSFWYNALRVKERIFYIVDVDTGENVSKRDTLIEVQMEVRKMNKKVGYKRYASKGGWVIHQLRG